MAHKQNSLTFLPMKEKLEDMDRQALFNLAQQRNINDEGCADRNDLIERIILTERKQAGASHNPFDKFQEVQSEEKAKSFSLQSMLSTLRKVFGEISTEPLSEVLMAEKHIKHKDLKEELYERLKALQYREPTVIIAGETNGGKSTFLNLILGVKILPTDVMHCTFAICKIKYSQIYLIETIKNNGEMEMFPINTVEEAREKLKTLVAEESMKERQKGSMYKEITLHMPSPILKSGVTLVDTPGIGEGKEMDDVTFNYITNTRASAFIYVIKSDAAGGIQEDKLVRFLEAIQADYKKNSLEGAVDPRAALFVCNRWDTISVDGLEKVKKNALVKLDTIWPGFEKEQIYFFSSKRAQCHLDADPKFVTDDLNQLVLGLKNLFDIASHNDIQHQYWWTKYFVQLASRHLRSMIHHCISSQEEQTELFRLVAAKQETLMSESTSNVPLLQNALAVYQESLKEEVHNILLDVQPTSLEDYDQLVSICSTNNFLKESSNRDAVHNWVVSSLIYYCDKKIQEKGVLDSMEADAKQKIKEHIGLFEEQIKDITDLVKGRPEKVLGDSQKSKISFGSSCNSISSLCNSSFNLDEIGKNKFVDLTQLNEGVTQYMAKRKKSGLTKLLPKAKSTVMSFLQGGSKTKSIKKNPRNPSQYLDACIQKNATQMRDSPEIIEGFAVGYLHLINLLIKSAMERIPHFIEVNKQLMENIKEHRRDLREDKNSMRYVMQQLEPFRDQLRGYGLLYMEDLNADLVDLNVERGNSCVNLDSNFSHASHRPHDSGFSDGGSTLKKAIGFWTSIKSAILKIDNIPQEIMIKKYNCLMERNFLLKEIACLRCLEHRNLAPFFGMTRIIATSQRSRMSDESEENVSSEKVSAFIFKGYLVSAHSYRRNKLILKKDFIRNFLQGLFVGLEFIHQENLVHMELNLHTVMVNSENGNVQLCQQCSPRKAELPSDLSIPTGASVCLSPAVLHGEVYGICDDIYAFGLLLWELLFPQNLPFSEQRQWPLDRFRNEVNAAEMLGSDLEKLNSSAKVKTVLKGALLNRKGQICMAMVDIKSYVQSCYDEPAFKDIPNTRQAPVRRMSRDQGEQKQSENIMKKASDSTSQKSEAPGNTVSENKPDFSPTRSCHRNSEPASFSSSRNSSPIFVSPSEPSPAASGLGNSQEVNTPDNFVTTSISQGLELECSQSCKHHNDSRRSLPNIMPIGLKHDKGKRTSLKDFDVPQIYISDNANSELIGENQQPIFDSKRSVGLLIKKYESLKDTTGLNSGQNDMINLTGNAKEMCSTPTTASQNNPSKTVFQKSGKKHKGGGTITKSLAKLFKGKKPGRANDEIDGCSKNVNTDLNDKRYNRSYSEPVISFDKTLKEMESVLPDKVSRQSRFNSENHQELEGESEERDGYLSSPPLPVVSGSMRKSLLPNRKGSPLPLGGHLDTIHSPEASPTNFFNSSLKEQNPFDFSIHSGISVSNYSSSSNSFSSKEDPSSLWQSNNSSFEDKSGRLNKMEINSHNKCLDNAGNELPITNASLSMLSSFEISTALPSIFHCTASENPGKHFSSEAYQGEDMKTSISPEDIVMTEKSFANFAASNALPDLKERNSGTTRIIKRQCESFPDEGYNDFNHELSQTAARSSFRMSVDVSSAVPSLNVNQILREDKRCISAGHEEDRFLVTSTALPSIKPGNIFSDELFQNDNIPDKNVDSFSLFASNHCLDAFEISSALPVIRGCDTKDKTKGACCIEEDCINYDSGTGSLSLDNSSNCMNIEANTALQSETFHLPCDQSLHDETSPIRSTPGDMMPAINFTDLSFMDDVM